MNSAISQHSVTQLSSQAASGADLAHDGDPVAAMTDDGLYPPAAVALLRPRLWTFAMRLAGNRQDALALVRRACRLAFESPEDFPSGFATPSTLYSLVHRIWFRELRHERAPRSD
jgi:hypothetical protein